MGIFKRIFAPDKNKRTATNAPLSYPKATDTIYLHGDHPALVYVHFPYLLSDIKVGEVFKLRISLEHGKLFTDNGDVCDKANNGHLVVYDNRVLGASYYYTELFKRLDTTKHNVIVDAIVEQIVSGKQVVKLQLPQYGKLEKALPLYQQMDPDVIGETDIYTFNLTPQPGKGNFPNSAHDISLQMIPTPKGSSAKPHIGCWINKHLVFEINARMMSYDDLLNLVDKEILKFSAKKMKSKINDGYYYLITFVYKK